MIHLVAKNFFFSNQNDELQINYDDYKLDDINSFLLDNNQIERDLIFYIEKQTKVILDSEQQLSDQGIEKADKIILNVEYCPYNCVFIKLYIDNKFQVQQYVSIERTCHEFLKEAYNNQQFSIIELRDKEGNIISTEMYKPFQTILKPSNHYELYVYTSQETLNPFTSGISQKQCDEQLIIENTIIDPIELIDQLLILPKMSIWIDKEGSYLIYKFHPPLLIKGVLKMSNGVTKNIKQNYDFIEKSNISFAQIDQQGYAYIIKWPNGTYNSIQIQLM